MRGEQLPIKEALVRISVIRRSGRTVQARFQCDGCKAINEVPKHGEGQSIIQCGKCELVNYLSSYTVVSYEL